MTNLVGRHLEQMADMRSIRKRQVVFVCSVVSCLIMVGYGILGATAHNLPYTALNLTSATVIAANIWYSRSSPQYNLSDLVLSGVLLFYGVLLLFYGSNIYSSVLWLFPILATVIFINDFRVGLIFSGAYCLLTALAVTITIAPLTTELLTPDIISANLTHANQIAGFSADKLIVSLVALSIICNLFSYYYSQAVSYIQSLYQEGIEDLAYMDQLTGLANRWSFENWARSKLIEAKDSRHLTALVFLDIDDFKTVNDTYGHDVGDRVLQHFANRLKNNVRNKDRKTHQHDYSIARFAGDEFVLLLYDVKTKADLDSILNRICCLFANNCESTEQIKKLTVSVGAAIFPCDGDSLSELTRCADKAMYAAKHGGKNQYRYYHQDSLNPLQTIDTALESALDSKITPFKKTKQQ